MVIVGYGLRVGFRVPEGTPHGGFWILLPWFAPAACHLQDLSKIIGFPMTRTLGVYVGILISGETTVVQTPANALSLPYYA